MCIYTCQRPKYFLFCVDHFLVLQVGQLAAISTREGQLWPELLPAAKTLCDSNDPAYLESGLILLDRLAEYAPSLLKSHVDGLIALFSMGMSSCRSLSVRVAALKATCSYIHDLGDSTELQRCAQALVGAMLEVVQITLSAGEEDVTREALSALNTIAERQPKILIGSLEAIAGLMLSMTKSDQLDPSTRQLALEFLVTLCERSSHTIMKRGWFVIQSMIPLILDLLAESDDDEPGEDAAWTTRTDHSSAQQYSAVGEMDAGDEDGGDVREFAAAALDRCALALGGDGILMVAAPIVSTFADSTDWRRRRAALQGLAMLGEGCKEEMLGHLPTIIPPILKFSRDPNPHVRYQLNCCILQMSVDFCEGVEGDEDNSNYTFQSLFHKDILPVLLASLESGGVNAGMARIQALACAALFHFCDYRYFRRDWLLPFAPALLEALLDLVSNSNSSSVKEEAIGAVTQLVQVLGPKFELYCERFILALRHLHQNPGVDNPAIICGRAIEAMVMTVCIVRKEKYLASLPQLVQHILVPACAAVQLGDPIVPFLFPAISRAATVLKSSFVPYLSMLMPPLVAALSAGKAFTLIPGGCEELSIQDGAECSNEKPLSGNVATVSYEIRGLGRQRVAINTAAMEDTKRACQAVGHIAQALGAEFSGWAGECLRCILPYLKRSSGSTEEVRSLSYSLVPRLLASIVGGSGSSPNASCEVFQLAIESMVEVIVEGPEGRGLAASGNPCSSHELEPYCLCADALCNCLKLLKETDGTVRLRNDEFEWIVHSLIACAAKSIERMKRSPEMRSSSLTNLEEDGVVEELYQDDGMDEDEWERDLLVSVVDSIGWVIKSKKSLVLPIFERTLWPFCESLLSSELSHLRHFALCMCVDVAEHCGPSAEPFLPHLLPILINMLQESGDVPELCQAGAYGLAVVGDPRLRSGGGKCVEFEPHAASVILLLLAQIHRQDAWEEDRAAATDNCVGGALHLLTQHEAVLTGAGRPELQPPHIMLQLLSWMPLRNDILEAQSTHELVLDLIDASHPLVMTPAALPHVVQLLFALLSYIPTDDELDALHTIEEARRCESDGGDVTASVVHSPPPTKMPILFGEEPLEDMWDRQLLSEKSRTRGENILVNLKATQGEIVLAMWQELDQFSQKWATVSTSKFENQVKEFRKGLYE